jgi:hypothetical protein
MKPHRHHLRLDEATQAALDEFCRLTLSTKSALMRRYVQEGVQEELAKCKKGRLYLSPENYAFSKHT